MSENELRRVSSPGKFEGCLVIDEYLFDVTLEGGADEEAGDCQESGQWFGLVRGPFAPPADADVTPYERDYLSTLAGAIVREDDQGFVAVDHYRTEKALDKAWAKVEKYFEGLAGESSGD